MSGERSPTNRADAAASGGRRDPDAGAVRAFVALLIDETTRAALAARIEALRQAAPRVAWVAPENLHLTLKFLGGVDALLLSPVTAALRATLAGMSAFEVQIAGLGAFPSATRARVLWAGVTAGHPQMAELAARVQAAVGPMGFASEDRPFSPHLTLGRVREPRRDDRLAALLHAGAGEAFGTFSVGGASLMRSVLGAGGARYSELARIQLDR